MKKIRRLFSVLACVLVMSLGLSTVAFADGLDDENLQAVMESMVDQLNELTPADAASQYDAMREKEKGSGVGPYLQFWAENGETIGTVESTSGFEVSRDEENVEITCVMVLHFKNEEGTETEVVMTGVIDNSDVSNPVWDLLKMDINKSMGEKLGDAALNTLMGMGTVFILLILISCIIALLKYVPRIVEKFGKKETEEPAPAAPAVIEETAVEEAEEADDLELVAVITAAIAASEGTSADGLVVRSIRRKSNSKWKKA